MAELLSRTRPAPAIWRIAYTIEAQSDRVTRLAWSNDGARLAVPSRDGGVRVHDAESGTLLTELEGHAAQAMGVAWSPDDRRLASIGGDEMRVWDVARGTPHESFACAEGSLTGVAWADRTRDGMPGGMLVATSETGCVLRWRDRDERPATDVGDDSRELPSLTVDEPLASPGALHASFSPDGRVLAVGSRDGAVRLWDPWSAVPLALLQAHTDASVITAWSPDGLSFASGAKDGTCRVWNLAAARTHAVLQARSPEVRAIAWHPGGGLLATKSCDGIAFWREDPWRPVAFIDEEGASVGWSTGLAFHPRLPLLATLGGNDRLVRVWWLDADRLPHEEVPLADRPAPARHRVPSVRPRRRVVIV